MAVPLSADKLLAALKAEGCKVTEPYSGWRTHNRNHKGDWGGVNGVVIHHTAGTDSRSLCYHGTTSLPGPLCHSHLAKNGTLSMIGHGRTNHAGTFAANAHNAVVNEASVHPYPDTTEPIDGNRHYYGLEVENLGDGIDYYPWVQYDQAVRWAAALCRAHGWTANSVIGHREGTRRKIDPRGLVGSKTGTTFNMSIFRAKVAERLARPANWNPDTNFTPEDTMALTDAEIDKIAARIWTKDNIPTLSSDEVENPYYTAGFFLRDIRARLRKMETTLDAQASVITELSQALATLDDTVDPEALVARIEEKIESLEINLVVEE